MSSFFKKTRPAPPLQESMQILSLSAYAKELQMQQVQQSPIQRHQPDDQLTPTQSMQQQQQRHPQQRHQQQQHQQDEQLTPTQSMQQQEQRHPQQQHQQDEQLTPTQSTQQQQQPHPQQQHHQQQLQQQQAALTNGPSTSSPKPGNDQDYEALRANYLSNFDFHGIQCSATPLLPAVLRGITTHMPVLFQIKVGKRSRRYQSEFARTPFNAVLVLDISGSMAGDRLNNCKKAIKAIIESLTARDTLSLVVYSTTCEIIFADCTYKHKEKMLKTLTEIRSRDMTNLHGGLELGVLVLRQSMARENIEVLKRNAHRVFLFSDGLVNEGVRNQETILADCRKWVKDDISISAFGIGDDYDEKLMNSIAKASNGDSFFIETEADIEDSVARSLHCVSSIIAPAAILKVRGGEHAVVQDIPGYRQEVPGCILLKHLSTNGLIQLVVNLDIRAPGLDGVGSSKVRNLLNEWKILQYELSLKDGNFVDEVDCGGFVGTVSVKYTSDGSLVTDEKKHDDVVSYLTIRECARMDDQVAEHLVHNRVTEGLRLKEQVMRYYQDLESKDRWGLSHAMLRESERAVSMFQDPGSLDHAVKMCAASPQSFVNSQSAHTQMFPPEHTQMFYPPPTPFGEDQMARLNAGGISSKANTQPNSRGVRFLEEQEVEGRGNRLRTYLSFLRGNSRKQVNKV